MAKVNPDLVKERQKSTFNVEELTYIIDGGQENTEKRRHFVSLMLQDPYIVGNLHIHGQEECYESNLRRTLHFLEVCRKNGLEISRDDDFILSISRYIGKGLSLYLHFGMFIPTIKVQGTDEQKEKWLPLALNLKILGTYAQTEMGHGTFVRGLETTATYDPKTEEFILNSPTLTSYKWWPGFLGKTSTHAVVAARLITLGKDHGIHFFIVALRSLKDHTPLPGVTLGDIGPKMGGNNVDNGFLVLNQVRIPRENMLMRFFQVDSKGIYKKTGNEKILYGTLLYQRNLIASSFWFLLAKAMVIGIRYNCVRRQTATEPGGVENQILNYQTQQYQLLPGLATAFALRFFQPFLTQMYEDMQTQMNSGNFDLLPELHATLSCLKAYSTWTSLHFIEACRLCCGGHGYSLSSGIPEIYMNINAACTYDGDNTILCLQTARYLIKCLTKAKKGQDLPSSVEYLLKEDIQIPITSASDLLNSDVQVALYGHRSRGLANQAGLMIQTHLASGKSMEESWNMSSVDLVKSAKAHAQYLIVRGFTESLKNLAASVAVKNVLKDLCDLFSLYNIREDSGSFMETASIDVAQIGLVNDTVLSLLSKVRPNAVSLVDAFDMPDKALASVLGQYDGNVYEHIFQWAQQGALNKTQVLPSYHKYIKPILEFSSKL